MSWNNGYVTDIAYTASFFREQSPVHLNFACLLNGYEPVPLDQPFTYCELGCGRGFTSNILAAANPQGQFYAFDFMAGHVAEARELAEAAGLDNMIVRDDSFADLAAGAPDLPQFDFVTMYGVYGWVNEENRRHLVTFLDRHLKPGGIVFVNYNTMPGWSATQPLKRLILDTGNSIQGTRSERGEYARRTVAELTELEAGYFTANASSTLTATLNSIRHAEMSYFAHEYMNDGGQPMFHKDVAQQLAEAGLEFMGQAALTRLFPDLNFTPQQRALLEQTPAALRETTADFLTNIGFRQDVYVRGARRLAPERQAEYLRSFGLALTLPRHMVRTRIELITDEVIERDDLYVPVLDALVTRPHTLAELMALPALQGETVDALFRMAALLIGSRSVSGCILGDHTASQLARQMNNAVAFSSHYNTAYCALASPILGNGILTSTPARLAYRALRELGEDADADALTERVWHLLRIEGRPAGWNLGPGAADMSREDIADKMQVVRAHLVPIWRQLGVI